MKLFESSVVRLTAGLTFLAGLWWVGNKVNINLAQLPVEQAADVSAVEEAMAVESMFPVAIQPRQQPALAAIGADSEAIEAAFGGRTNEDMIAPAPNFAEMIRGTVRIDGVSSGGVFVAGRFYAVGSEVTSLQASAEGLMAVPRVVAARPNRVVFDVGGSALVMTKEGGAWH